jgi:hypothetical protein
MINAQSANGITSARLIQRLQPDSLPQYRRKNNFERAPMMMPMPTNVENLIPHCGSNQHIYANFIIILLTSIKTQ